jgi:hypothetical protein
MISTEMTALADRLAPYQSDGCELHPVAVVLLVAQLRELAEQARHLEDSPVPPHYRGELPPNVIRFPERAA